MDASLNSTLSSRSMYRACIVKHGHEFLEYYRDNRSIENEKRVSSWNHTSKNQKERIPKELWIEPMERMRTRISVAAIQAKPNQKHKCFQYSHRLLRARCLMVLGKRLVVCVGRFHTRSMVVFVSGLRIPGVVYAAILESVIRLMSRR